MGLTFAVAYQALIEWQDYRKAPTEGLLYFDLYGGFSIFLAVLCLYSFVKARNVR